MAIEKIDIGNSTNYYHSGYYISQGDETNVVVSFEYRMP